MLWGRASVSQSFSVFYSSSLIKMEALLMSRSGCQTNIYVMSVVTILPHHCFAAVRLKKVKKEVGKGAAVATVDLSSPSAGEVTRISRFTCCMCY